MGYQWYDNAGRPYGFSVMKVAYFVNKHGLKHRKIHGCLAVDYEEWERLMRELHFTRREPWARIVDGKLVITGEENKQETAP